MWDQAVSGIISGIVIAGLAGIFFLSRNHAVAFNQLWNVFFAGLTLVCLLAGGFALGELYGVARIRDAANEQGLDLSSVEYAYVPLMTVMLPLIGFATVLWIARWLKDSGPPKGRD